MTQNRELDLSRRGFLRSVGILTAGVGLGIPALAACSSSGPRAAKGTTGVSMPTPRKGGTLTFGMTSISPYLNPLTTTSSRVLWITDPITESLYTYDDQLNSIPLLAAGEPTVSKDGLTWTIKLKAGVTFSNGDRFTADHVAATLNYVSNPKSISDWTTYFAYYVKSSKAISSDTVQITLSLPYGILRSHLTNLPIVHKAYVAKTDTTIGTGPFVLGKVTQGQSVELTRNRTYHGSAPALDGVSFVGVTDPATRLVNLREGKISIMTDVPAADVALLKKESSIQVHVVDAPVDILTYFNAKVAPFNNVKVRQALAYATDRQGVLDVVYSGQATIAQGPVGPAEEGYDPNAHYYRNTPDIAKAKALLAEAGVSNPKFTLMISTSATEMTDIAQVLMQSWSKAGFDVTLQSLGTNAWVEDWVAGKYQLAMTVYESGFGGGKTSFVVLGGLSSQNPLNLGYKNPRLDALLYEAWSTQDATQRAQYCQRAAAIVAADAIDVPPVYPKFIVAQRTDVSPIDEALMKVSRIKVAPLTLQS